MKKILSLVGGLFAGIAIIASAQVAPANMFRYIGTSIVPVNASSTIGTTTRAVAGGYFNNLTVSGTCTGCSGSGVSTTTIAGITSNSFIFATTTTGSVFSFATSSNTITFRFPATPSFTTLGITGQTTLATASSTGFSVAGNLWVTGVSTHATSTITNLTVSGKSTLANASSTALTVSGNTVLATTTMNGDFTLNGGVIARTVAYTASTSVTILTDTTDIATITVAHATTTFNTPTGTLWNGKMFEIMLTATTTRGLAWSTGFASSTDLAMPITTASGTAKYIYEYRSQSAKWELNGLLTGFTN